MIWAIIPAILYYVACFAAVHFEAKRRGLHGLAALGIAAARRRCMRERGHLFIPVVAILAVMYSGYSAPLAALVGTLLCFPVAALRKSTRGYVNLPNIIDGLRRWRARTRSRVALACACAGIVIGVVTLSGLGIVFTQFVVGLAQDTLLLALVLTMIAGIVLGMGMPTTPAYIIMTALLVPAIIKLGVIPPAAHMFAFYFAVLSAITPPVALAVYAAAGIAKADLWTSGLGGGEDRRGGLHRAVHADLRAGAADDRDVAARSSGVRHRQRRHPAVRGRPARLFPDRGQSLAARAAAVAAGLLLIDPGLVTDIVGCRACGHRHRLSQWYRAPADGRQTRRPAPGQAISPERHDQEKRPEDLRSHRWLGVSDLRSFGHRSRLRQFGYDTADWGRQAGHRHHQYLERHQHLPRASARSAPRT